MAELLVLRALSEHLPVRDLAKLVTSYCLPDICVGAHVKFADNGDKISNTTGFITEIIPRTVHVAKDFM